MRDIRRMGPDAGTKRTCTTVERRKIIFPYFMCCSAQFRFKKRWFIANPRNYAPLSLFLSIHIRQPGRRGVRAALMIRNVLIFACALNEIKLYGETAHSVFLLIWKIVADAESWAHRASAECARKKNGELQTCALCMDSHTVQPFYRTTARQCGSARRGRCRWLHSDCVHYWFDNMLLWCQCRDLWIFFFLYIFLLWCNLVRFTILWTTAQTKKLMIN